MPLALESLVFDVQTQKLLDAKKSIDELSKSMQNLNKVSADDAKASIAAARAKEAEAKAAVQLARAKEAETKVALVAAKVNAENWKTSIAIEADNRKVVEQLERKAAAEAKATAAAQQASQAAAASLSVLERQKSILDFMTQGFSKGQASVMAYAKANGALATELQQLESVLQTQRKLIGGDPFDKSMSGLTALKNQYGEIREAMRQYNSDMDLTRNQTRELARDKERIIEKMKLEGSSFTDIKNAIRDYNQVYTEQAAKVNSLIKVEKDRERSARDHANAIRNVQAAEERLFATTAHLNDSLSQNATLNERAALAVGSYERNLRLAGITGEQAAKKLQAFSAAQAQITAAENKRMADYVARGVGVQMGDVGVSLASGQNPFIVMIQQGDQIRGLIQQAGRDGLDLANVMNDAAAQIGRSFKEVGIVVGTFVSGAFVSAGKAVYNSLTQPLIEMFEVARTGFDLLINTPTITPVIMGPNITAGQLQLNNLAAAVHQLRLATLSTMGVVATLSTVIGGVFLLSTVQVTKATNEMNSQILQFGASLGITLEQAKNLASSISESNIGVTFAGSLEAVGKFAKSGITDFGVLNEAVVTSVELQKNLGIEVEKTVEKYSAVAKDPVKGLIEIANNTGLLTEAQIRQIQKLEDTEGKAFAVKAAMDLVTESQKTLATESYNSLSDIEKLWLDIKKAVAGAWGEFQTAADKIQIFQGFRDLFAKLKLSVQTVFNSLQGVALLAYELLSGNFNTNNVNAFLNEKQTENLKDYEATMKDIYDTSKKTSVALIDEAKARQTNAVAASTLEERLKKEAEARKKASKDAEKEAERIRKQALKDEQSLIDLKNKYLGKIDQTTEAEQKYKSIIESDSYAKYAPEMKKRIDDHYLAAKAAELHAKGIEALTDVYKSWGNINKGLQSTSLEIANQNEDIKLQYALVGKTGDEYTKIKIQQEERAELNKAELSFEKERLSIVENYIQQMQKITTSNLIPGSVEFNNAVQANAAAYEDAMSKAEDNLQSARGVAYQRTDLKIIQEYERNWKEIQSGLADALYTSLTEGGKKGAVKVKDLIKAQLKKLAMEPITFVVNLTMDTGKALLGMGLNYLTGGSAGGGLGSAMGLVSTGAGVLGAYKAYEALTATGTSTGTAAAGAGYSAITNSGLAGAQGFSAGFSNPAVAQAGIDAIGNPTLSAVEYYRQAAKAAEGTAQAAEYLAAANSLEMGAKAGSLTGELGNLGTNLGKTTKAVAPYMDAFGRLAQGDTKGAAASATLTWAAKEFAGDLVPYVGAIMNLAQGDVKGAVTSAISGYLATLGPYGWIAAAVVQIFGAIAGKKKMPSMGDAFEGSVSNGVVTGASTGGGYDKSMGAGDILGDMATAFASTYNGVLAEFGKKAEYDIALVYRQRRKSGEKSGELRMNGESIDMGTGKEYSLQNMFESVMSTGLTNAFAKSTLPDQIKKLFEGFERFDMTGVTTAIAAIVNMNQFLKTEGTTLEDFIGSMDFEAYRLEGEKNVDIVSRMLTSVLQMNETFDKLGLALFDLSSAGFDATETLKAAFGGLEGLNNKLASYYNNYYTAEEKRANVIKDITDTLLQAGAQITEAQLGSATRAEFRAVFESIVEIAGASSPLAIAMLQVEDAFAGVTSETESLTEATKNLNEEINSQRLGLERELMQLLGDTNGLRNLEIESIHESNRALKERIWSIEDSRKAANDAFDTLQRAVDAEKKILSDKYNADVDAINNSLKAQQEANKLQEQSANEMLNNIKKIFDALSAALDKNIVKDFQMDFARQQAARLLVRNAASSNNIFATGLEDALSVIDSNETKYYSTFEDYARDQLLTGNDIAKLKSSAESQMSTAELTLLAIKNSSELADGNAKAQLEALKKQYDSDIAALDQTLVMAQAQLDAMNGVNTSVLSVKDALAGFQAAISGAMQAQTAAMSAMSARSTLPASTTTSSSNVGNVGGAPDSYWNSLNKVVGLSSYNDNGVARQVPFELPTGLSTDIYDQFDPSGETSRNLLQFGLATQGSGSTFASGNHFNMQTPITDWMKQQNIPSYDIGTNKVPNDMLANIHKNEAIIPAKFNPWAGGTLPVDNTDLAEAVAILTEEVQMLRYEARATAINTSKMTKQLDRSSDEQDSIKVTIVSDLTV